MRTFICCLFLFSLVKINAQSIVINEVLSSNNKTMRDPIGDFDDYLELYNTTEASVDVSRYLISDDKDSLLKCILPAGIKIDPKGYLLVWLDGEMDQKGIHCGFKLSAKGERVILTNPDLDKLDEIKLKRQYSDISFGRYPDGGDWRYMNPSPISQNLNSKVLAKERKTKGEKMKLKVDSSKDKFVVTIEDGRKLAYRIMDKEDKIYSKGAIVGKGDIVISDLENGKYVLYIGKNVYRILKQH